MPASEPPKVRLARHDGDAEATLERCLALKGSTTVSVVVPALDEEPTVGAVVSGIATMVAAGLVDELLVVDGGSTDRTRAVAVASGAQVIDLLDHMPGEPYPGKGGALWLSLQHTSGDVLLFLDADVAPFAPGWVPAMVEPLLATAEVMLVKGCYARPVGEPGRIVPGRGGRVTELVARPLLALFWPELAGIRQPLAGETAARRSLLQSLPFASGYGVEIGLLLDSYARHGLDAIAQVDLGVRWHAPQEDDALARMSAVVLHAAMRRVMPHESTTTLLMGERLWQYVGAGDDGSVAYDIPHRDFLPHVP